jgi:hypothetical protein
MIITDPHHDGLGRESGEGYRIAFVIRARHGQALVN